MTGVIERMQSDIETLRVEVAALQAELRGLAPIHAGRRGTMATLLMWKNRQDSQGSSAAEIKKIALEALERAKDAQRGINL